MSLHQYTTMSKGNHLTIQMFSYFMKLPCNLFCAMLPLSLFSMCHCHNFLWITMLFFFIGEYKETELTRQISWHVIQAVNFVSNYRDIISTRWRVKSPTFRLFVQQPIWTIIQVISELCITDILCEEFTVTGGLPFHYSDISALASQITSLRIVYYTIYWGVDQRKYQSSVSLAFVWGIHWWQRASRKMLPFDDVIMQ